ncbi:MAG: PKD domain-containing protein [Planctomycetota bacterium]
MLHRWNSGNAFVALAAGLILAAAGCSNMAKGLSKFRIRINSPPEGVEILAGDSVDFQATVKGGVSPYDVVWVFGDGIPSVNAEDPGLVAFPTKGTYTVVCKAEDAWNNTETATVTVIVRDLVAQITSPSNGTTILAGGTADFQGSVQGGTPPYTYQWDFGGAATGSTVEDPGPVTFPNTGTYFVTFTVTDSLAETDTDVIAVTVQPPLSQRTKADIQAYWSAIQPTLTTVSYGQNPNLSVGNTGYEGELNPQLITEGVAWVNFYRWLAGLPDNVTEDALFRVRCQKGAHVLVMLEINGDPYTNPHNPPLPSGATPTYESTIYGGPATVSQNTGGWLSCASSNIFRGWGGSAFTPVQTVDGYMDDLGNDSTLGHRRWILYPRFTKTAFGTVWGSSEWASNMYVLERPSFSAPTPSYDFVAYPSPGFYPLQCFTRATALWSFSVNSSNYDLDGVTQVTVIRDSDSQNLNVTTEIKTPNYGITPTISFNPGEAVKDETYHVTIHDIWDTNLQQRFDHSFSVTFFDVTE